MKKYIFLILLFFTSTIFTADQNLPEMTEMTDIQGTDLLYVVDDPSVSPADRKITAINLFDLIDTFTELDTIVADKSLVNKEDGAVWGGVHDFGGSTSLEIPNGSTITLDADGETGVDTNVITQGMMMSYINANLLYSVQTRDLPTDNQVPQYDSATGTINWEDVAGGVTTLPGLDDVFFIKDLATADVLLYDAEGEFWLNAVVAGDVSIDASGNWNVIEVGSGHHGLCPTPNEDATYYLNGTGNWSVPASSPKEFIFSLEGTTAIETAFGSLYMFDGTNYNKYGRRFDDTVQEFSGGKFIVPQNIDTAGTVTFVAVVTAVTGAADKFVQLSFEHKALTTNEAWDAAMTAEDSGDKAIDPTTGDITIITWTETVANLGWVAGDYVPFRISRKDTSAEADLSGDMAWFMFSIRIPQT